MNNYDKLHQKCSHNIFSENFISSKDLLHNCQNLNQSQELPPYISIHNLINLSYIDTRYLNVFGIFANASSDDFYEKIQRVRLEKAKTEYAFALKETISHQGFKYINDKAAQFSTRLNLRQELAFKEDFLTNCLSSQLNKDDLREIQLYGHQELFNISDDKFWQNQYCPDNLKSLNDSLPNIALKTKTLALNKIIADCNKPQSCLDKEFIKLNYMAYSRHEADKLASCGIYLKNLKPEVDTQRIINSLCKNNQ